MTQSIVPIQMDSITIDLLLTVKLYTDTETIENETAFGSVGTKVKELISIASKFFKVDEEVCYHAL